MNDTDAQSRRGGFRLPTRWVLAVGTTCAVTGLVLKIPDLWSPERVVALAGRDSAAGRPAMARKRPPSPDATIAEESPSEMPGPESEPATSAAAARDVSHAAPLDHVDPIAEPWIEPAVNPQAKVSALAPARPSPGRRRRMKKKPGSLALDNTKAGRVRPGPRQDPPWATGPAAGAPGGTTPAQPPTPPADVVDDTDDDDEGDVEIAVGPSDEVGRALLPSQIADRFVSNVGNALSGVLGGRSGRR